MTIRAANKCRHADFGVWRNGRRHQADAPPARHGPAPVLHAPGTHTRGKATGADDRRAPNSPPASLVCCAIDEPAAARALDQLRPERGAVSRGGARGPCFVFRDHRRIRHRTRRARGRSRSARSSRSGRASPSRCRSQRRGAARLRPGLRDLRHAQRRRAPTRCSSATR